MRFRVRIRYPVLVLFGIYLFQAFVFAVIYQRIHKADPGALLFNTTIIERQLGMDRKHIAATLAATRADLRMIEIAQTFPSRIRKLSTTPAHRVPIRGSMFLNYEEDSIDLTIWWDPGGAKQVVTISLTDERRPDSKGFEYTIRLNIPENFYDDRGFPQSVEGAAQIVEAFDFYLKEEMNRLRLEASGLEQELKRIERGEPQWQFVEYLYFSVTSVVGGAYGDIMPNSRTVRMIIIVQFLFSISIVGFLVSIAAKSR